MQLDAEGIVFYIRTQQRNRFFFPLSITLNTMEVKIRRAKPRDARVIVEFNASMAEETEHRSLDSKTLSRGVKAILADSAKGIYFVAEADDRVVGQLMITYEWSDWRNGNFWWIQSVYVRKEYRQQGVFRSLYEYVELRAKERKGVCGLRLYVERQNGRAQNTYENMGMKRSEYEMFEKEFTAR